MNPRIWSGLPATFALLASGCSNDGPHLIDTTTSSAVLAGACIVNSLSASSLSNCTNLQAFSSCAADKCGFQSCRDTCTDYESCIRAAGDPCTNGCVASTACQNCLLPVSACSANSCLGALTCGTMADGGACDKLEACCAKTSDALKMTCELGTQAARIGGDPACEALLAAPPPIGDDAGHTLFGCSP